MDTDTEPVTFSSSDGGQNFVRCSQIGSEYLTNNVYTLSDFPNNAMYISQPQNEIYTKNQIELKELLVNWNCEEIFQKCVEESVDIDCLKLFKFHHIKLLMKGFSLGLYVKFENKLIAWQRSIASTICSTLSEDDIENATVNTIIDVRLILKQTNHGKEIMYEYKDEKNMTDAQRNFVVNVIIDFVVSQKIKMSSTLAKEIAEQIVDIFKYEEISIYYKKTKGKHVSGKIYQKYFNKMKSLENVGLKKKLTIEKNNDEPVCKAKKLVPEENISSHLEALKSNECTWSEVEDNWGKTSNYRLNEIQHIQNTAEILEKWNHFRNPLGYKLVLIDFRTMFPLATDILSSVDKFPVQMEGIYKRKIKETAAKSLIGFLHTENIKHNGKLLTTFYLLHYVLVPTARIVTTVENEKKHKKYSIRDSQNAFVIYGHTVQQLEEELAKRIQEKVPIQPLLLIRGSIGDPIQIFVYYDNVRYELSCVARAIDICFKLFHIFNLKYPPAANLFWTFIQSFFYNMNDEDQHSTIKILIKELNQKEN